MCEKITRFRALPYLIHKPLDRLGKALLNDAPRLFLDLFGVLDSRTEASVETLSPETAPAVKIPDYVARITISGRDPFILHLEFEALWHPRTLPLIARLAGSLAWQYEIEIRSILVLIQPQGCPETVPEIAEFAVFETRTTHPFRTVRLWELDPAPVLECGQAEVLPWAVLMKSSDEEVQRLASHILEIDSEEHHGRLFTLASFRYHKDEFTHLIGVQRMALAELIEQSWFWKELTQVATERGMAQGIEQGLATGITTGKVEEARHMLHVILASKYPGLETMPELNSISDVVVFEKLLVEVAAKAADRESAERAIREAAA